MMTYSYRQIFNITSPLALGILIQFLVGMTDTAFLGRIGAVELGASALAGIICFIIFTIAQSFGIGAQIIMARRNGEKNYIKIAHVFYQILSFIFLLSGISIALIYWLGPSILSKIIQSPLVINATLAYLLPRCWGLFFSGAKTAFRAFFVAITFTRQLLPAAIILLVANFIFDYWLIFGGFGIQPMGIAGAAIASVLAEALAVCYLLLYVLYKVNLRKYGFHKFLLWSQSLFAEIFRLSVWIVAQNLLGWSVWLYFFIEIEKLGETALAISNILRSASQIPFIVATALAMAVSTMISNLIGASKEKEVLPTIKRTILLGIIPYYGCIILMAIFPRIILQLYTDDMVIVQQAIPPFYTMLLSYLTALPGIIYFYAIYGTGHTKAALSVDILSCMVYLLSIRLVVGILKMDLVWCWALESFYYLIFLGGSYGYMNCKKWHDKTTPNKIL